MGQFPTLRDVASMAGVSIGTASQALNNRPNVSPETRSRVVDAALALGYDFKKNIPISTEKSLSVIGMLTKHDFGAEANVNPFYVHIQAGVESECRKRNLSLMYANIEVDRSNRPMMWPNMISEQRVDGLILMGTFIEDTIGMIQKRVDIPIVLVDSYAPSFPFDSVVIDNLNGAASAVNYLLQNDHKHIGLVGCDPYSPPGVFERRIAYSRTLQANGIHESYIEDSMLDRKEAYEATKRLLRKAPEVSAIFAVNDDTAIGAMNAVLDMGLKVPNDCSIVGFDNIDVAREVKPGLTTVHVHKTWMGALAVRLLLDRASNPDQPRLTVTVATELVVRDSVREMNRRSLDGDRNH